MEQQITWLILTVVLNGLLTGIIVVWYGKRLESRLGRENFEHQTKFSKTYSQRVEVLETFYRKFLEFSEIFCDDILTILPMGEESKMDVDVFFVRKLETHAEKLLECQGYFKNNRLFLSAGNISEIEEILHRMDTYLILLIIIIGRVTRLGVDADIKDLAHDKRDIDLKLSELKAENPNIPTVLYQMTQEVNASTRILESLYKSTAQVDSNN